LRYQQEPAADIGDREVHAALGILEYAVVQQPLEQAPGLDRSIVAFHGNEHQQPGTDARNLTARHFDRSRGHALQEPDQMLPVGLAG
jgi:hypothetical protein